MGVESLGSLSFAALRDKNHPERLNDERLSALIPQKPLDATSHRNDPILAASPTSERACEIHG